MATVNGSTTPTSAQNTSNPSTSATKRKRSGSNNHAQVNGASLDHQEDGAGPKEHKFRDLLTDILGVLKSFDTEPSILDFPLQSRRLRSPSGEPSAKRKKLSRNASANTIAARLDAGTYTGLDELVEDVEHACSEVLISIQGNEQNVSSLGNDGVLEGVLAFKAALKKLMIREAQRKPNAKQSASEPVDEDAEGSKTAADGDVKVKQEVEEADELQNGRTVLTIYGSAQGPKQLFSSLQQPVQFLPKKDHTTVAELDSSVDVTIPLPDGSLPNIISTTKIVPMHTEDATNAKRVVTIGELLSPPAALPQLTPPKPAKQLTTRGNSVSFVSRDSLSKSNRRGGYFYPTEVLSTGQWLGYSGVEKPQEPSSTEERRKQRDRALSMGESKPPLSEATQAALQQAKADALFRSVYASFAPDHDDASAVVPERTKSAVWWHKMGQKRYEQIFAINPALVETHEDATTDAAPVSADEEKALAEAVADFVPESNAFAEQSAADQHEKETDEVLKEISELLETLYSYQRIRHSSLASNSRTPVSQNTPLTELTGSPTSPSSAEIDVYKILRAQLSLMIASLPPYAVAKLNGEQLEELNISKNVTIEAKDYKGTMEEDTLTRALKNAAIGAAAAATPVPRIASSGSHSVYPAAQTQYGRSTPAAPAAGRVAGSNPQSYFPQQQPSNRTPALQHQRSYTGTSQSYQTPAPYAAGSQRPPYASQAYNQHTPRPSYGQTSSQQYYQPRAGQQSYGQYYQNSPQTQPLSRSYQQQPPSAYQQRAQNPPSIYSYGSSQNNISLKAGNTPAHAQTRQYYQPPVSQGYGSRPATPSSGGPNSCGGSMSAAEQQAVVERQRAQLAMPPARGAAQANMTRPGSGTPQPPNSQHSTQVNGASPAA